MLRADGTLSAGPAPRRARQLDRRSRRASPVMKPGTWQHVTLTYDGSSRAAGIGLFVDGVRPPTRGRHRSPAPQHRPRRPQEELGRRQAADPHRPPRRRAPRRRHGRRAAGLRSPALAARGAGARRRRRSARRRAADPGRDAIGGAAGRAARTLPAARRSGGRGHASRADRRPRRGERAAHVAGRGDGDARARRAAPDVHAGARRLRRADRAGGARHAGGAGRVPEGPAGQPPRAWPAGSRRPGIR